ncbi:C40 family peptidase [Photobacterium leiognathi]|uniref:C40 family peptidase n=1 Tax=Photobacterium leiognathi TaxID=553611 RepID=UPI002980DD94|nr:C40 family peptidase [Photobacterium leiognathi]
MLTLNNAKRYHEKFNRSVIKLNNVTIIMTLPKSTLALFSCSLFFLVACESTVNASPQTEQTKSVPAAQKPVKEVPLIAPKKQLKKEQEMIKFARKHIGTKYVWGGNTPKGFDCSGFIKYVYNKYDISIPRTTAAYPSLYYKKIALKDAKVGDLIVFTGTNPKIRKPGHAGIITEVGKRSLKFVHSSSSKKHFGVTETDYYKSGYSKRYLTVVRM